MKILVTGGAGFIGSAVVRHIISEGVDDVVNLDKLTYAANLETLAEVEGNPRYVFVKGDICDASLVRSLLETHRCSLPARDTPPGRHHAPGRRNPCGQIHRRPGGVC